jgi:hypothetical protein
VNWKVCRAVVFLGFFFQGRGVFLFELPRKLLAQTVIRTIGALCYTLAPAAQFQPCLSVIFSVTS